MFSNLSSTPRNVSIFPKVFFLSFDIVRCSLDPPLIDCWLQLVTQLSGVHSSTPGSPIGYFTLYWCVRQVCDWPETAGCTGGTPTEPPTPDVDPDPDMECDCECCLKPNGDDCTTYYMCKVCILPFHRAAV